MSVKYPTKHYNCIHHSSLVLMRRMPNEYTAVFYLAVRDKMK